MLPSVKLALGPVALAGHAVPAFVRSLVYISLFVHPHEEFLYSLHMPGLRGADEIVVGALHGLPQLFDAGDDAVDIFLRRDSGGLA